MEVKHKTIIRVIYGIAIISACMFTGFTMIESINPLIIFGGVGMIGVGVKEVVDRIDDITQHFKGKH